MDPSAFRPINDLVYEVSLSSVGLIAFAPCVTTIGYACKASRHCFPIDPAFERIPDVGRIASLPECSTQSVALWLKLNGLITRLRTSNRPAGLDGSLV